MTQYQSASFKLDMNNPTHRKAMQYLSSIDREKFPTVGDAIVTAVVNYFEGGQSQGAQLSEHSAQAPASHTEVRTQQESDMDIAIEKAVERSLEKLLPAYFEKYAVASPQDSDEQEQRTSSPDIESNELSGMEGEIDWGFLGG